jgi:tRNA threonylcarbamoyladenosine biosynthesis protein TsaB
MEFPSSASHPSSGPNHPLQASGLPRLLALSVHWDDCSVALGTRLEATSEVWSEQPERAADRSRPGSVSPASRDALLLLDRLLVRADTALSTVDRLCFARGPGAFTSLRVAAGLIQGLALATSLPVVGICSLAAMAAQDPGWAAADSRPASWLQLAAIDARMGECYFGLHECRSGHHPVALVAPAVGSPADAIALFDEALAQRAAHASSTRIVPTGNAFELLPELAAWALEHGFAPGDAAARSPTAAAVLAIAASIGAPEAGPARTALPVYIRDKIALDVTEQRAGAAARAQALAARS